MIQRKKYPITPNIVEITSNQFIIQSIINYLNVKELDAINLVTVHLIIMRQKNSYGCQIEKTRI